MKRAELMTKIIIGLSYALKEISSRKNAANLVTAIGIFLIFLLNWLLWFQPGVKRTWIFYLNLIVALTDWFDGWIARKFQIKSALGDWFDKGRDKAYVVTIFIWVLKEIWQADVIWLILVQPLIFIILAVELLLVLFSLFGLKKDRDHSAQLSGEIKMTLYFVAANWWFLFWAYQGLLSETAVYFVFCLILLIAWFFSVISGNTYYERFKANNNK